MAQISDISLRLRVDDDGAVRALAPVADQLGAIDRIAGGLSGSLARVGSAVVALNQAWELASRVVSSVSGIFRSVVDAADAQDRALVRLRATLAAAGQASDSYVRQLSEQASALQQVTRYGDEQITELQRILIQMGATRDTIDPLVRMTLDLAAAFGTSAEAMAELVGAGIGGKLDTLLRTLRIRADEGASAHEKWALVVERWRAVAGLAAADAETFSGRVAQLRNAFGDALEALGATVTRSSAVQGFLASLRDTFGRAASLLAESFSARQGEIDAALGAVLGPLAARIDVLVQSLAARLPEMMITAAVSIDRLAETARLAMPAVSGFAQALGLIADALAAIGRVIPGVVAQTGALGATLGALVGTVIPGVGTATGAAAGALIGGAAGLALHGLGVGAGAGGGGSGDDQRQRVWEVAQSIRDAMRDIASDVAAVRVREGFGGIASSARDAQDAVREATESIVRDLEAAARAGDIPAQVAARAQLVAVTRQLAGAEGEVASVRAQLARLPTLVTDAERIRAQADAERALLAVEQARRELARARESGTTAEEAAAVEQLAAAIDRARQVEANWLDVQRARIETTLELARVTPEAFDVAVIEQLRAELERLDVQLAASSDKWRTMRDEMRATRAASIDLVDVLVSAGSRAVQASLSGGSGGFRAIISGAVQISLSDILGQAFRGAAESIRRSGAGGLAQAGQLIALAATQSIAGAGIADLLRGNVQLAQIAGALLSIGALAGGPIATITGASGLASALGLPLGTVGAAGGALALGAIIARPFLEPGTTKFLGFDVARTGLSTATGAAAGAAIGSIIPGIGTVIGGAIGAAIGFVAGLFGGAQPTREDRTLRQIEQMLSRAGLPGRVVFRDESGAIRLGPSLRDTVFGRSLEELVTRGVRGNIAEAIDAALRQPPEVRRAVAEAVAVPGLAIGRAVGLLEPEQLGNVIANTVLALGRGVGEAREMLLRVADAAGIDFARALTALHDQFEQGALSASQLLVSVGSLSELFSDRLPPGLDATRLAAEALDEAQGALDISRLQRALQVMTQLGQQLSDAVAQAMRRAVAAVSQGAREIDVQRDFAGSGRRDDHGHDHRHAHDAHDRSDPRGRR